MNLQLKKVIPSISTMKNTGLGRFLKIKSQEEMIYGLIPQDKVIIKSRL